MYQGHLYELPSDFNAGNMFYSTDAVQAGRSRAPRTPTWTHDDFHNSIEKVSKSKDVVRLRLGRPVVGQLDILDVRQRRQPAHRRQVRRRRLAVEYRLRRRLGGGRPHRAAGAGASRRPTPPATVEALRLHDPADTRVACRHPRTSGGGGTLQGLFAAGRIGTAIGGGFWAGGLHNAGMKPDEFDVQFFPKWKSQRHLFGTGGYAIFNSSQKKEVAWEVLKLLAQPESFDLIAPGNVTTPARKSLCTAERYQPTGPKNWSVFYDTLTQHPDTAPIPAPPYYNALATALNTRTTEAISTGNAKAALDGLQADLEAAAKAAS